MDVPIMSQSEFFSWKKNMEEKIERKELTPLEEGNVRLFCVLQLKKPCYHEDIIESTEEE
jgi:hypothetical protein